MMSSKLLSALGMFAIGGGVAFAVCPARHVRVWTFAGEPRWLARTKSWVAARRSRALGVSAAELVGGLALVLGAQRLAAR